MTDKKPTKKYTRRHLNWRVDYDYKRKLNEKELAYLETFTDEYYRNSFNGDAPVHDLAGDSAYSIRHGKTRKGTVKQQLMYEEYIRRRDIIYNKSAPSTGSDYYPELYSPGSTSFPEVELIDLMDEVAAQKNNSKEKK